MALPIEQFHFGSWPSDKFLDRPHRLDGIPQSLGIHTEKIAMPTESVSMGEALVEGMIIPEEDEDGVV